MEGGGRSLSPQPVCFSRGRSHAALPTGPNFSSGAADFSAHFCARAPPPFSATPLRLPYLLRWPRRRRRGAPLRRPGHVHPSQQPLCSLCTCSSRVCSSYFLMFVWSSPRGSRRRWWTRPPPLLKFWRTSTVRSGLGGGDSMERPKGGGSTPSDAKINIY